jgi:hypothetical protein
MEIEIRIKDDIFISLNAKILDSIAEKTVVDIDKTSVGRSLRESGFILKDKYIFEDILHLIYTKSGGLTYDENNV